MSPQPSDLLVSMALVQIAARLNDIQANCAAMKDCQRTTAHVILEDTERKAASAVSWVDAVLANFPTST